jgi:uncharacterized membrane protein YczE
VAVYRRRVRRRSPGRLMMAAIRCTGKPLGFCRCALECFAVALGFALGGSVGVARWCSPSSPES